MSRRAIPTSPSGKLQPPPGESVGETFSLQGTLADYEVEELDAHQAAALLAKRGPRMRPRGHAPSLRLVQTGDRL